MRACVRVRLCVYVYLQRAQSNEEFEKKVRLRPREFKNPKLFERITLRMKERESLGKRSRLDFNTRQSLILFYYKFVLLQTASTSASANK